MIYSNPRIFYALIFMLAVSAAACTASPDVEIPLTVPPISPSPTSTVIIPTPLPPPPKTLIVCLNQEPSSLYLYSDSYLYGDTSRETSAILQAIYDGPYDLRAYDTHPVILQRIPDLVGEEGAFLEEFSAREGDVYLNPESLLPEVLKVGSPYLPVGCERSNCIETYLGDEVNLQRMVVEFQLLPDLTWSDGEPLTAVDSVFSYNLDRHPDTPTTKYLIDRTYSYTALDELTVQWIGIPGFYDKEYLINFWSPLPEHVLQDLSPRELLIAPEANRDPIGWGPYRIEEWQGGDRLVLSSNPNYFRAGEGLPAFDFLIYRFIGGDSKGALQQLITGECDVLDESLLPVEALPMVMALNESGSLRIASALSAELFRLDFNLEPIAFSSEERLFADPRTRRALASCLDRERVVDEIFFGLSAVPTTYLSPIHPLHVETIEPFPYDPTSASIALEELGWIDDDGSSETPRIAQSVTGVRQGTPFSFEYLTSAGTLQEEVAERLREDLKICGVELRVVLEEQNLITAPWPEGLIFGRGFDSVGWNWPDWISPLCEMFSGSEVPSALNPFGSNASGFNDPDYNLACNDILLGYPGSDAYLRAVAATQELFASALPSIPLYLRPRIMAYSNEICGVEIAPLVSSGLWGIETLDSGEKCEP